LVIGSVTIRILIGDLYTVAKNQPVFKKGFWLDAFYIQFNFFLFSLIGYNARYNVGVELYNDFWGFLILTIL
tara:strand:- start:1583 stop:1798 length:216 start_codon:yes stop_codon:yes gene_type:complete